MENHGILLLGPPLARTFPPCSHARCCVEINAAPDPARTSRLHSVKTGASERLAEDNGLR